MTPKDTAKLSAKFQISVPKSVYDAQGWQAGQVFAFIPKGTNLVLVPVPKLETLFGAARGRDPTNYRNRNDRF